MIIRPKHKEVLKKMSDNVGMSREEAQIEMGHSKTYARSGHIAETDSWKELMEKHIPDYKLLKVEKEGLEATKILSFHTEPDKEVIDYSTRHKYLETGLKLKGKLKEGINVDKAQINIIPIYMGKSKE